MALPMPELPGVEHRWIEVGGVKLHVAEAGAGEPVVLQHGWPQHWWEWRGVIPRLAQRYRVICPDLRGFGWSDAPRDGYEKEQLVDDTLGLLDALGHERVRFVGHDWGGVVGFLLCLRAPERIERYLALNTGHPWTPLDLKTARHAWRFTYQAVISAPVLGPFVVGGGGQAALRRFNAAEARRAGWSDEDVEIFLAPLREPARARASQLLYRTFVLKEIGRLGNRYRGRRLTVPTLFLHGTSDPVLHPDLIRGLEERADDARIEYVPKVGHFIADERPDLVAERALEFFGPG